MWRKYLLQSNQNALEEVYYVRGNIVRSHYRMNIDVENKSEKL